MLQLQIAIKEFGQLLENNSNKEKCVTLFAISFKYITYQICKFVARTMEKNVSEYQKVSSGSKASQTEKSRKRITNYHFQIIFFAWPHGNRIWTKKGLTEPAV